MIVVSMDYRAVLVNVSVVLLRYTLIDFRFFIAGRDGIKGDRGDSGRNGKKLIYDRNNYLNTCILFQVILVHPGFLVHKVSSTH